MNTIVLNYTPEQELQFAHESIASVMTLGLDKLGLMKDKLKECFPSIIKSFSANEDLTKLPKFEDLSRKEKAFIKEIEGLGYAQLREFKAYVPEGMIATYLEYATALRQSVEHLKYIAPNVLEPYVVFLGHLVSNKKSRLSSDDNAAFYATLEKDRQMCYELQAKCFSEKHHSTDTKVGSVIERNADWPEVFSIMRHLVGDMRMVNREKVKNLVKQCEDYLEIIYQSLQKEEMGDISPEVSSALAKGAYVVATELEYFSIVYYRILALESSIDRTLEKLTSILNK